MHRMPIGPPKASPKQPVSLPQTRSSIATTGMNIAQYTDGRLNAVNAIAVKVISNSKLRSRNLGMAENTMNSGELQNYPATRRDQAIHQLCDRTWRVFYGA